MSILSNVAISGTDLDAKTFAPLEWSVQNIIPEGFGLIVAPPKAGKSWLVAGIGLACAAGETALGHIAVEQRPVLYLALEDGERRLQSRCRQLLGDDESIPDGIWFVTSLGQYLATDVIAEFLLDHAGSKPLIILDTLGKVKPPKAAGQDAYQADYAVGSKLKGLVDAHPGSTLLVVHHTRKMESDDFVDAVSGTQGIAGSADFILVLRRKRQSDEATLAITGRDVEENEVALRTDNGHWMLSSATFEQAARDAIAKRERENLGEQSNDILDYVNSRAETTPADIAKHFNIDNRAAATYLGRLFDRDKVSKSKRGVYTPVVCVVSDVTESTDDQFDNAIDLFTTLTTVTTHPD